MDPRSKTGHGVNRPVTSLRVLYTCGQASNWGTTIFIERFHRGIVPCPPIVSGQVTLEDTDAVYWYFRQADGGSLLISYFRGTIAPQNGIPEGVYDITRNFSLVIENVTDLDEGIYFFTVKPKLRIVESGQVAVAVKVSPQEPYPSVAECNESTRKSEAECEALLPYDTLKPRLTCIVENAKPAVAVRWLLVYSNGDTELVSDKFTVQPAVPVEKTNTGSSDRISKTFTTSALITISSCIVYETAYRCEAYGDALGDKNGSHVTATVTKAPFTEDKSTGSPASTATATRQTDSVQPTAGATLEGPSTSLIVLALVASISIVINCTVFVVCMGKRVGWPFISKPRRNNKNSENPRTPDERSTFV